MEQDNSKYKFRVWDKQERQMYFDGFYITPTGDLIWRNEFRQATDRYILIQFTGLKSDNGKGRDLYEGDSVYLAGYGDYVCEFPFLELYEAAAENDLDYYRSNIHENPELLKE